MIDRDSIQRMLVIFAEDTQSLYESCTRTDGTFPDARDQDEYEMRIALQQSVEHSLTDFGY